MIKSRTPKTLTPSAAALDVPARDARSVLRDYVQLAKPRIALLLVFTTVTAMIIAADGLPPLDILLATMLGGVFASGGASAINQYYDRDMDAMMARTKKRPIAAGRVSPGAGLTYGLALVALSGVLLAVFVNLLAAVLALGGAFYYVVLYTMLLKRNTVVNIVIGGGAGAMPVLVGWAAVTGGLALEAWLLFLIVFYWTPPHSWALALLVNADYKRAGVPMMPAARGGEATRRQIILYSALLVLLTLLPTPLAMLGWIYGLTALLLGFGLMVRAVQLFRERTQVAAKTMYKYSTGYLALLFLMMMVDRLLL
ncbi:MAG: protoheme IX farnesyltransferase [Anaerolineae bacterium]|nr:protoheme IX farnesyltransferase [Anaerolineae bacterium]